MTAKPISRSLGRLCSRLPIPKSLVLLMVVSVRSALCSFLAAHYRTARLYGDFFVKVSIQTPQYFCFLLSVVFAALEEAPDFVTIKGGGPPAFAVPGRDTTLYSAVPCETHHDAVIRIVSEVPRRRPHFYLPAFEA